MPTKTHCLLLTTLLGISPWTQATTIHRCEAANGSLTYTTMSCAAGESLTQLTVRPFMPGSAIVVMPEASHEAKTGTSTTKGELTIVGQAEDRCGNMISAKQRREAIINQRIIAGMSQQDVESALGKPDKIKIRNSATSYRYDLKRGRSAQVEFDEKGCVRGNAKSQTAKSPR